MSRGVPAEPRPRVEAPRRRFAAALYRAFERFGRLPRIAATIVLPAGAAIALLAVATDSSRQIDSELHLIAPDQARPGDALPIRAQLFRGLRRPEGAELALADVEIALRARDRHVIARTRLSPSFAHSLEGALSLPPAYRGAARIEARVQGARETAYAERWVWIDDSAPGLAWHARELTPLQSFAAAPVRAEEGQIAPAALDARVAQGACVPEHACELLVHVGEPAAALRVLASPSATPDVQSAQPSAPTSGVVRVRVTTHGPEAQVTLRAERDGVAVATRALRLPVALGVLALQPPPRVLNARAQPRVGLEADESGCIADAFLEQRWLHSAALRACRGGEALPFALEPGIWRVQLRRDPFASESASVFTFYVRAAGESEAEALRRIATAASQRDASDALARTVAADPSGFAAGFEATAAYLLAVLDVGVIALPAPVSSYPRAIARAQIERDKLRALSLLVLAACAVALGLLVLQRGLRAAAEASRVMEAAGEEPRRLERQRARMALHVLATVTSLLLAFVAIAVYMIVRGRAP